MLLYTARGVLPAEAPGQPDADALAGKVVIDLNNQEVPADFVFPAITLSLAERLAQAAPGVRVVKAFNTMAQETFEFCPEAIRSYRVSVFVAGDHEGAPDGRRFGRGDRLRAGDCGPLMHARLLEGAADLIRLLMINRGMSDAHYSLAHVPDAEHPRLGERQASLLNREFIPNFGERHRQSGTISTVFVEPTINQVVSRRFIKKQQMQWTPRGAHLLLQTRTKVLNGELEAVFQECIPDSMQKPPDPPNFVLLSGSGSSIQSGKNHTFGTRLLHCLKHHTSRHKIAQ